MPYIQQRANGEGESNRPPVGTCQPASWSEERPSSVSDANPQNTSAASADRRKAVSTTNRKGR